MASCPAGVGPHCQVRATLALAAQWCHLVVGALAGPTGHPSRALARARQESSRDPGHPGPCNLLTSHPRAWAREHRDQRISPASSASPSRPSQNRTKPPGTGRAGNGSNADVCSHCHEGSWSESQVSRLKGSWHPGRGSLVEEGAPVLHRQQGPQGARQLPGEAELRSCSHSVRSRPSWPY